MEDIIQTFTEIMQYYTDEKILIQNIIFYTILTVQTIINLFVIFDYTRNKSNTKLIIATTLITLLIIEILNFVL